MSDEKGPVTYQVAGVESGGTLAHTIHQQTVNNNAIEATLRDYYRQLARECQLHTLAEVETDTNGRGDDVYAKDIYVQPDVLFVDAGGADARGKPARDVIEADSPLRCMPLQDCLTSPDPALRCLVLTAPSGFGKSTAINARLQTLVEERTAFLMLRLPSLRVSSQQANVKSRDRVERALAIDIAAKLNGAEGHALKLARSLIDKLDAAPGVILFDALDEVPQGERDDVVACVRSFLREREREQPALQVLVTSRPYAYTGQFEDDKFKRIELVEFAPAQQDELVVKWFAQRGKSPATGEALINQLQVARSGASTDQAGLAQLMTEPMLLTYACMLAEGGTTANSDAPLPPTRYELFDGVVSLMLEKWDPRRKHGAVDAFRPLFDLKENDRSTLRWCLETLAVEQIGSDDAKLNGARAARNAEFKPSDPDRRSAVITRERLIYVLDMAMPPTMAVRALAVADWLAQRSGFLQVVGENYFSGPSYALHKQLLYFLAVGGLLSKAKTPHSFVDAMLALFRCQPEWYRQMLALALARLRSEPLPLTHAINEVLAAPVDGGVLAYPSPISAINQNTPDFVTLHFVIAWANAFGEAGPSCMNDLALAAALQKLRERCLELVTAPAEGKPPIELRAEAADALGVIGDPRFDPNRWHLPAKRVLPHADEPIPGFVRIAAGEFMMGDKREKDNPQRKVLIEHPFYIARYATTVAQFRHFVDDGGYDAKQWWDDDGLQWLNGQYDKRVPDDEHLGWLQGRRLAERRAPVLWARRLQALSRPVVGVSWFEARAYARWLDNSLRAALKEVSLADHVVLLPTEPQRERAARWAASEKGATTAVGRGAPTRRASLLIANPDGNRDRVASVGLNEATELGLFDMVGNAWEWMDNAYRLAKDDRFGRAPRNQSWQHSPTSRDVSGALSLRGGSWMFEPEHASFSYRRSSPPVGWHEDVGFRVLLSLAKNET